MSRYTDDVPGLSTTRVLEAVRRNAIRASIYQAFSSEMFRSTKRRLTADCMKVFNSTLFLIVVDILVLIVVIYQLLDRALPIHTYFLASIILGLVTSIALGKGRLIKIFHISLLFLLVKNLYYIATLFSVFYGTADVYAAFNNLRSLQQEGRLYLAPPTVRFPESLNGNSLARWPALQFLCVFLSQVSNIDILIATFILVELFSITLFIFMYLMMWNLVKDFNLTKNIVFFALLIAATSPFVYSPPVFKYQDMGSLLLTMLLYISHKQFNSSSRKNSLMIIVISMALVITHHYTTFAGISYFFLISIFILSTKFLSAKLESMPSLHTKKSTLFLHSSSLLLAFFFIWINYHAVILWPHIKDPFIRFIEDIKTLQFTPFTFEGKYPNVLTPTWGLILLYLRNILMLIPVVPGFILFLKKVDNRGKNFLFIACSSVTAGVLEFTASFIVHAAPYRVLCLLFPFIGICTAMFYYPGGQIKMKRTLVILRGMVVVIFVFSSFIGLNANRFLYLHFFDPKIDWSYVGEHSPDWRRTMYFLSYTDYNSFDKFASDDYCLLSLCLPLNQFHKMQGIQLKYSDLSGRTLVILFNEANPSYMDSPWVVDLEYDATELRQKLCDTNKLYDDEDFTIWEGSF